MTKSVTPSTTAQSIGALLKSARDIMRKDKGLNGDLDRLPLLTCLSSRREEAHSQMWNAERGTRNRQSEPRDLGCHKLWNKPSDMISP